MTSPLPVTVLVGFLGSGKTTLLQKVLTASHGRKIAVVVNDYAALNIDAQLVRQTTDRLVEMSNGCICCTLREDLVVELRALSKVPGLDYILIESTGIGEPMPIAQAFHMEDLPERVRLDTIVTVVDAAAFWKNYHTRDMIEDAKGNLVESSLAPLLVDQLEFSNVVLLNKIDLADAADLDALEGFVRKLNPSAKILRTQRSETALADVLGTGRYDYAAGEQTEGWEEEWVKASSEVEEYGFASLVYRQPVPLDRARFMQLFEDWPPSVMRAKGFVVFADDAPALFSLAGDEVDLEVLEPALESDPPDDLLDQPLTDEIPDEDLPTETEIVFIGRNLPREALVSRLDACRAL